jgi:ADP-dependent NAD(P)H-hydrate dehydratase / NAD(P)H-hydrate epimerase
MYIAGQAEMKLLDQYTMEKIGLPGVILMENAGEAVVKEIMKDFPDKKTKIIVLAGSGNNGGDGFVIARRLIDFGYEVILMCCVEEGVLQGDAKVHYDVYKNRMLPMVKCERACLQSADVIVDALLGTGLKGAVREPFYSLIQEVNAADKFVYAVDIPSGVNADTGLVMNAAMRADKTITFALPKKGFYLQQGPQYTGEVICADISVPTSLVEKLSLDLPKLIDSDMGVKALPKRPAHGHKGTFGHVLVIGGCKQYVGAPMYTAKAAFQSGAGLVTLAIPEAIYPVVAAQSPECLFMPLQHEGGAISSVNFTGDAVDFSSFKVIAIGPGLGRQMDGVSLIRHVLARLTGQTLIIDADGLYFARDLLKELKAYKGDVIFTPHPGEMSHLTGQTVQEIEKKRLETAKQFSEEYSIHLLLKGHRSIVTTITGNQFINPYGNDALGKGGSGDVLTGLIASFISQGAKAENALIAASYYHASAAEQLGMEWSTYSVTPIDLIDYIRKTL